MVFSGGISGSIVSPMSILAEFVAVSPDELAAFVDDPESVMSLFLPAASGSFDSLVSPAALERLAAMTPDVIARAQPGLSERDRDELAARMATMVSALRSQASRSTIVASLGTTPRSGAGERRRLSLDKAWHGAHYLLSGEVEDVPDGADAAVLGGTEFGEDDGYGPPRYFTVPETANLAAALEDVANDGDMAARYDANRMNELGIYPGGWDVDGRGWLLDAIRDLRLFYADAAARGAAVVTLLT